MWQSTRTAKSLREKLIIFIYKAIKYYLWRIWPIKSLVDCRPIKSFQRAKYSPGSATQSPKFFFSTEQTGMVTLVRPR